LNVQFISQIPEFQLDTPAVYRNIIEKCALKEGRSIKRIIFHFVSDDEIVSVNQDFLNHNYITDIITFDNSFLQTIDGEIFICLPEVKRNAFKHTSGNFKMELDRVILHGILHLIGYKDGTNEERKVMREKESFYLQYF
jgi:probable rRNA maturation factor